MNSYLEKKLIKSVSGEVELHLKECASCRKLIHEVERTLSFTDKVKQLNPDPFMFTRIQQQIVNQSAQNEGIWRRALQPVTAVFVLAIGLFIGISLGSKYYNDSVYESSGTFEYESSLNNDDLYLDATAYESIEAFLLTE